MKPIMSQGAEDAITGELFERTPVGMVVTSTKDVLIRVNSAVCSFLGYSKQELLGKTVRVITHPADWSESKRRMRQMWAGGAFTRRFEKRYVHKNGKTLWGDVSVFTTCDERGKPQFSIAQIFDITERKKVEEKLRESNERLQSVFQTSPIGIYISRADTGKIIEANDAFLKISGYSVKQIIGHSSSDLGLFVNPKDRKHLIRLLSKQGWFSEEEIQCRSKSGDVLTVLVSGRPLALGGESCILGTLMDITERKRTEEALQESEVRLKSLTENVPSVLMRYDRQFRVVYLSRQAEAITGIPVSAFLGKTNREVGLPKALCELWEKSIAQVFRTGKNLDLEFDFPSPQGPRTFFLRLAPELFADKPIKYVLGISTEITDRKRLEDKLRKSHDELETKVKERTARLRRLTEELTTAEHQERRRIADILHEQLQQHLCGMKFRVIALKERISDPASIGQANLLVNELDHAIHMTRTLTTDIYPPVLSHLGIRDAIEWLATDMMKKLDLKVGVETDKRIELRCDAMRVFVFEAVRELLLNVSKHAKVKTAEIRADSTAKGLVRIQVRDEGVGFDPKRNSGTNSHFGLFRIQERAEGFGGRLEVSSQPNKGTCVSIILPLGQERS